jgi:hypothetical protein
VDEAWGFERSLHFGPMRVGLVLPHEAVVTRSGHEIAGFVPIRK